MRDKIKALLFLMKCVRYIGLSILQGRTWNILSADIEDQDGLRTRLTYRRACHAFTFDKEFNGRTYTKEKS